MLTPRPKVQGKVLLLPVDKIVPSAHQARTHFDEQEIARLALSIAQNGLLQPVSVRPGKEKGEYELVAGERRLRACKLAGLAEIPAILTQRDESQSAALGLLENIQRQGLDPFEQARGIREVITLWGCTQEEAAKRLGIAQPTLNNKLRLLALNEEQQAYCIANGLTERHARAVLKLKDEEVQLAVIKRTAEKNLSVKDTERLVEKTLDKMYDEKRPGAAPRPAIIRQVRDYRLFMNTVNSAIAVLRESGMNVEVEQEDLQNGVDIHIRITNE